MNDTAEAIVEQVVAGLEAAQRRIAAAAGRIERAAAAAERRRPPERAAAPPGYTPAQLRAGVDLPPVQLPVSLAVAALQPPSDAEIAALGAELEAALGRIDVGKLEVVDVAQLEAIGKISGALSGDLAKGLAEAIAGGRSLGDVLVDSFARAGTALLQSQILRLLDPAGDGSAGFVGELGGLLGRLVGAGAPRRASGGAVSAGRLYRVNEAGIEGFRPAGSGTIVPLGRIAARPAAAVTVVQPLNVSFAGAITTPELMAQFKAYADGVAQAAAVGGAAMAEARIARRASRRLPG